MDFKKTQTSPTNRGANLYHIKQLYKKWEERQVEVDPVMFAVSEEVGDMVKNNNNRKLQMGNLPISAI